MTKILTVGDVVLDIIPSPFPIAKSKILEDGESFIDAVTFQKGGCAGNFVCVLKTIAPELDVHFVSRIGNDKNADFLIQEMEEYGVIPHFVRDPTAQTQLTIAVSYLDGERHFLTNLGALANFTIEDIPLGKFEGIDHFAYRGPWFSAKLLKNAATLLKGASDLGISTSLDLGFDPYWNTPMRAIAQHANEIQARKKNIIDSLPYVTFLFGNESEIMELTESQSIDSAVAELCGSGVQNVVLHRGSKGASVIINNPNECNDYRRVDIPAVKVKAINSVGTGDTFDSIFISQILSGLSVTKAAAMASAGAAFSLQHPPGTMITIEDVKQFLESSPELKVFFE